MIVRVPRLKTNNAIFNDWCEEFCAAVERALNISATLPLRTKHTTAGTILTIDRPDRCFAKITDTSALTGAYGWSEVYASATGGWTVLPSGRSGTPSTEAAWEYNKNTNVPVNAIVPMERNKSTGEWRFKLGSCS